MCETPVISPGILAIWMKNLMYLGKSNVTQLFSKNTAKIVQLDQSINLS